MPEGGHGARLVTLTRFGSGAIVAHRRGAIAAPPLTVVKGYSLEQFARLMKHGVPPGDRPLKLMGPTSQLRFANFTSDEVAAVHAYLQSRS